MLLTALVDTHRWAIRNGNAPLKVGDLFGEIRVVDIHATGRFLEELPANWTAVVTLEGVGVEELERGSILRRLDVDY